jgi:hypothetical protein
MQAFIDDQTSPAPMAKKQPLSLPQPAFFVVQKSSKKQKIMIELSN